MEVVPRTTIAVGTPPHRHTFSALNDAVSSRFFLASTHMREPASGPSLSDRPASMESAPALFLFSREISEMLSSRRCSSVALVRCSSATCHRPAAHDGEQQNSVSPSWYIDRALPCLQPWCTDRPMPCLQPWCTGAGQASSEQRVVAGRIDLRHAVQSCRRKYYAWYDYAPVVPRSPSLKASDTRNRPYRVTKRQLGLAPSGTRNRP